MKSHYGLVDHSSEEDGEGQAEAGGVCGGGATSLSKRYYSLLKLRMKETELRIKMMTRL